MAKKKKLKEEIKDLKQTLKAEEKKKSELKSDLKALKRRATALKKSAAKADAAKRKSKRKVQGLKEVLGLMDREIGNANAEKSAAQEMAERLDVENRRKEEELTQLRQALAVRSAGDRAVATSVAAAGASRRSGVATAHRTAWKRHQYLQDRFESHQEAGLSKHEARHAANRDLVARFGDDAGYTDDQLEGILM